MGDPLRIDGQGTTDLGRAAPLAGVDRDVQAAGPSDRKRSVEPERVRETLLAAGEVPADEPGRPEPRRGLGKLDVEIRVVRSERGTDQANHDAGPHRRSGRPAADRGDPVGERQAAFGVERRAPADLDVADPVRGLRLDELAGDSFERLGVLEEGDRQVEPLEQLGLRGRPFGRDERVSHPGVGSRRVDAACPGELERGLDPHRTVEVEVELRLWHRLDQPAQRRGIERTGGVHRGHGAMLPARHGTRPGLSSAR